MNPSVSFPRPLPPLSLSDLFCAGVQATKHFNLNSGLFYIRANKRTLALMDRIAARLAKERAWDQSVFNEEIFFLSHDDYVSSRVTVRVMNIYKFMNSKVRISGVLHMLCVF